MSRVIRMFERKARKEHVCSACSQPIQKKERYLITVVVWIEGFREFKYHRWDCDSDDHHEPETEAIELEAETETPLVLRDLVRLPREEKEKKHNDKKMEK